MSVTFVPQMTFSPWLGPFDGSSLTRAMTPMPCARGSELTESNRSSPAGINRKRTIRYDEKRYKDRWRIEAAFCRLKDFRRIATRYDKLAVNFLTAVALATIIAFWI